MKEFSLSCLENKLEKYDCIIIKKADLEVRFSRLRESYIKITRLRGIRSWVEDHGYGVEIFKQGKRIGKYKRKKTRAIIAKLKKYGLSEDTKVEIVSVDERFSDFEEADEHHKFINMNMADLLKKYEYCNVFSLTQSAYGKYIPLDMGIKANEALRIENKQNLKAYYSRYKEKVEDIPYPFETLYKEILEECEKFESIVDKEKYPYGFQISFICDEVGKTTKYNEPRDFIWHMYATIGMELDQRREILEYTNVKGEKIFEVLEKDENAVLLPNLNRYEIAHFNHCTNGGGLKINFYFHLNDENRKFSEVYITQHLNTNTIDKDAKVVITTIQRMYSMLSGDEYYDEKDEEISAYENYKSENKSERIVSYNPNIPIESFDFIHLPPQRLS